jgi:hypothetical protein
MVFQSDVRKLPAAAVLKYRDAERVRPFPLKEFPTLGHRLASRTFRLAPAAVNRLPRAWLVGKHAAAVTDQGRLLLAAFRDEPRILDLEPNEDLRRWLEQSGWQRQAEQEPLKDVCSLVSRLDVNYYHWLVEQCGQLEGIEHYQRANVTQVKLLIRDGGPAFLRESLELLGVKPEQIVEWQPDDGPRLVQRLVLPTRPGNEVACSPASLKWLRQRFLRAAGVDADSVVADKRLYIPRKQGGWRFVLNEDEVVRKLEAEGFQVVRPDRLSLIDQVRLFSRAAVILGMHGAGLTNMLFAPKAKVIELFGNYGAGEYYSMSSGLGNGYQSRRCETVGENISVSAAGVLRLLDSISTRHAARMPASAA